MGALEAIHMSIHIIYFTINSINSIHIIYFTTFVVAIHYNQRPLLDSRKFEGYVCLRKAITALLFSRCLFIPQN